MARNHFYLFFFSLIHFPISTKSYSLYQSPVLSISRHPYSSLFKSYKLPNRAASSQDTVNIGLEDPQQSLSRKNYYYAQIQVGQPATAFNLIIDTTSNLTWLQCHPCIRCYQQTDPIFDPTQSSSYHVLPCDSGQCIAFTRDHTCDVGTCLYEVDHLQYDPVYGKEVVKDFTRGELATESLTLDYYSGSSTGQRSGSFKNIIIGCGHYNGGSLGGAAGKLALSQGSISLPSQIKATSFSYCLVDRDSGKSSTLEFNSVLPKDSIIVPMLPNPKFEILYYVEVTGISVAGSRLDIPESVFQIGEDGHGGVIIDSSSAATLLPPEAYRTLRDAFIDNTKALEPLAGSASLLDTCYQLPSSSTPPVSNKVLIPDGIFPRVAFHFAGGKTLSLEPKNCLIPSFPSNIVCLSFGPALGGRVSVIGNRMQQGTRVTFDLANKHIGFSPNKC